MSTIHWIDARNIRRSVPWHSENGTPCPRHVVTADDRTTADAARRLIDRGSALLWQGSYPGVQQLLRTLRRRLDREPPSHTEAGPGEPFRAQRQLRARRARLLGGVLLVLEQGYHLGLHRAPEVRRACTEAYGPALGPRVVSASELLGVLGAQQWREKGVWVPALGARIHPHYGVFAPTRSEYTDLVGRAPLPSAAHLGPGVRPWGGRRSIWAPGPASWPHCSPVGAPAE